MQTVFRRKKARSRAALNAISVLYRLNLAWAKYVQGIRERYKLLMTPGHRGFFVPWLAYLIFIAITFRWETDLMLLGVLIVNHCTTPSSARLQGEVRYLPIAMALAIAVMMISLIPVQKGYLKAVPSWIGEALLTLLPISALMTLIGVGFYWVDLRAACGA